MGLMVAPSWKQFPNAFSILVIVLLCTNYFAPFGDLDFTWQIRTGRQIVETRQLRTVEAFTYTISGRQIPDFEWLYEVILWAIWQTLGFGGLKLLKTILISAPLLLVSLRLKKEGVGWPGIAVSLLTAFFVLLPMWNLRPLYCTTIGLLLVSGWLHDHCTGRRSLTWLLPVVMLLWANLHPGVIVGQGLLAGAIAWEWLNRYWKINTPLGREACWRLTLVGGLGLAATFASPSPLDRLVLPFRPEVGHSIQRIFVEMQPLYTFIARPPYTVTLAYILAGLVALSVCVRFRQYRMWELALLVGLTGLANLAIRSLQDWLLVMLALGVPHLAVLINRLRETRKQWKQLPASIATGLARTVLKVDVSRRRMLNSRLFRFQPLWPGLTLVVLMAISFIPALAWHMPIQNANEWPVAAVDWLESQELHGRFFGMPDYGSYVTWRLGDRAQCYVDTRGFFFPPELLEDSFYVPQMGDDWRRRLDRVMARGTDYLMLETTGPRGELWQAVRPHIEQPLYCDKQTAVVSTPQLKQALQEMDRAVPDHFTAAK